jgi:hypothetical protein
MMKLPPKQSAQEAFLGVEFSKIKNLMGVRLVDYKFNTGKDFLDAVRHECVELIRQSHRFDRELNATRIALANPKTLARERPALLEKMKNLSIGQEYAEQTLRNKLENVPFTRA